LAAIERQQGDTKMKKIVAFILLMCMVLTFAACTDNKNTTSETTTPENTAPENDTSEGTKPNITLQEVHDATLIETMLKNRQSISTRDTMGGGFWRERYLTKEYIYICFPGVGGEPDWEEFITDDAYYYYDDNGCVCYLSITPDGVSDFAGLRAEYYAETILGEDTPKDSIESVSQKDGYITVKSFCAQEVMEELGEISGKFEYVLDAKTRELLSVVSDYTFDDGTSFSSGAEISYDAEVPEMVKTFLKYMNQTEDLRNITVVSNPGTENEKNESAQVPKGLIVGFRYNKDSEHEFKCYIDDACTVLYDPYGDTDSDLTIYVKWTE
jgi:hypothetical protein